MSEVTQSITVDQIAGVPGNCVQAAVASLLSLPIEAVPHFLLWQQWNLALVIWLAEHGYVMACRHTTVIPDERCIVAGTSPRGIRHVCVAQNGQIMWDPHPSRDGLTSVDEAWFIRPETTP